VINAGFNANLTWYVTCIC